MSGNPSGPSFVQHSSKNFLGRGQTDSSQNNEACNFGTLNSESSSIWFISNPQGRSDFCCRYFCPKPFSCQPVASGFKMFQKQNLAKFDEEFTRQDSASHQRKVHNRPESAEEMRCFSPLLNHPALLEPQAFAFPSQGIDIV